MTGREAFEGLWIGKLVHFSVEMTQPKVYHKQRLNSYNLVVVSIRHQVDRAHLNEKSGLN